VNAVPDEFLLTTAAIAATLIGLLLLGGFFYVETGLRRATTLGAAAGPFLRSTTKFTLSLYALVLGLSLGLVVLRPGWVAVLHGLLSILALIALAEWTSRYAELRRVVPIPRSSPWVTWPVILGTLALPWVIGGWTPAREAMTWTVLLAGALALMSTADLLLKSFDLANWERAARGDTPPLRSDSTDHGADGT
jgi:hypothetical protein